MGKIINFLSEFSIPLILGVVVALVWSNTNPHAYDYFVHTPLWSEFQIFGHELTLHFFMNDIFMVLFFGIAAVEITQAFLPGGDLNPISKAVNPLFGTLGGIFGPIGVFFFLCYFLPLDGLMNELNGRIGDSGSILSFSDIIRGWGIPTATDIALAWLIARMVFGSRHPAVTFLLLVAVADDAIGLGIIAVFYPDPHHPVELPYLGLLLGGMLAALLLRKAGVRWVMPYLILGGIPAWLGLILAHLHPALALVAIVPFMPTDPHHQRAEHLFEEESDHSTLSNFEHQFKILVDLGLFGFGLTNAGVLFSEVNLITWIVLSSLLIGKTMGIYFFSMISQWISFPLPTGMDARSLLVTGIIAGVGLTVALFVAGEAYTHASLQGAAKMGALFSVSGGLIAWLVARALAVEKKT